MFKFNLIMKALTLRFKPVTLRPALVKLTVEELVKQTMVEQKIDVDEELCSRVVRALT